MGCRIYSDSGVINKYGIRFYWDNLEGSVSQHDTFKCLKEQEANTDSS